jgi:hypothetical protein
MDPRTATRAALRPLFCNLAFIVHLPVEFEWTRMANKAFVGHTVFE